MPTEAAVAELWESETCGVRYATSEEGTLAYYREIENARYSLEPFIREFADFARWRGRRVLEVELVGIFQAAGFSNVRVAGFPTPWDRRVAGPLVRLIRLDWFLGVVAA
jgi:hypothetical protein